MLGRRGVFSGRFFAPSFVILFRARNRRTGPRLGVRIVALVVRRFSSAFRQTGEFDFGILRRQILVVDSDGLPFLDDGRRRLRLGIVAVACLAFVALEATFRTFKLLQDADVGAANRKCRQL